MILLKPLIIVWLYSLTLKEFYLVKSVKLAIVLLCNGHSFTGTVFFRAENRMERNSKKDRTFQHTNRRQKEHNPKTDDTETDGVLKRKASNKI